MANADSDSTSESGASNNESTDESSEELLDVDNAQISVFDYNDPLLLSGVLRAVALADLNQVKALVEAGHSPNINDNNGNTPLHMSVFKDLPEIMDFLLSCDEININNQNFYGETALYWAAKNGQLHLVERLVKANADVNLPTTHDVTPLHIAAEYPEILHVLIKKGAKLDAVDYTGETALHEAVTHHCLESVCMLLYYKADANTPCYNNITPFMKAIMLDDVEIQDALFNYVYDFNTVTRDCTTLLNLALTHTCPYVKQIIERGADVNYTHLTLNAFIMCLEVPDVEKFSLIWKKFRYQELYTNYSYLEHMSLIMEKEDFFRYLSVILMSGNFTPIFEGFHFTHLFNFIITKSDNSDDKKVWYQISYDLIFIYLCFGYPLDFVTLHQLYVLFGYNKHFYHCLHMDMREGPYVCICFTAILIDTKLTVKKFKSYIASSLDGITRAALQLFIPHMRIPEADLTICPRKCEVDWEILKQVPTLLELARNSTRDYLVRKYQLYQSKQYYFFVKQMPIHDVYKKLLTFQKEIYSVDRSDS